MRKALGQGALALVTLLVVILYYVPIGHVDFAENWGEGSFGITLPARESAVVAIDRDLPADRAGVRPGDRLANDGNFESALCIRSPYPGELERLTFERGKTTYVVTLTARSNPNFGLLQRVAGVLAYIPPTVFLVVAFLLVFLRPSIMSWSFLVFAVGYFGTGPAFMYWSHVLSPGAYVVLSFVLSTVLGPWSVLHYSPSSCDFPTATFSDGAAASIPSCGAFSLLAYVLYIIEWRAYSASQSIPSWDIIPTRYSLGAFALAGLILAKTFATATPSDRQRFAFVALGTLVSFIAYAVYYVPGVPFAVGQVIGFAVVLMPICIAYAVFRLRVLDVNFVLNRALVFGVISVGVIAFVSLLDWFFARVVAIGRFAIGVELLATIAVGFLLDRINRRVEGLVETLFFRRRRIAERHLRRAASALPYATDEDAIVDGLVQIPVDALQLSAAALYRRSQDGARFDTPAGRPPRKSSAPQPWAARAARSFIMRSDRSRSASGRIWSYSILRRSTSRRRTIFRITSSIAKMVPRSTRFWSTARSLSTAAR